MFESVTAVWFYRYTMKHDRGENWGASDLDDELWLLLEQHPKVIEEEETNEEHQLIRESVEEMVGMLTEWAQHHPDMNLIIDSDGKCTDEQFTNYMFSITDSVENQMMTDPEWSGLYGTSDFVPYRELVSLDKYIKEREFQHVLVFLGSRIIYNTRKKDTEFAGLITSDYYKKNSQVVLAAVFPEQFTESWQEFFAESVPGASFDPTNFDDLIYTQQAEAFAAHVHERREHDEQVYAYMQEILGIDPSVRSIENARISCSLKIIQEIASDHYEVSAEKNGRASRNRSVCEYAHTAGFDSETIAKIADYLDRSYPIQSMRGM